MSDEMVANERPYATAKVVLFSQLLIDTRRSDQGPFT